jgi:hypothetical protein
MYFHNFEKLLTDVLPTELIRIVYTDLFEDAVMCGVCKDYFNSRIVRDLSVYRKNMNVKCASCIGCMKCKYCDREITSGEKIYRYHYLQLVNGPHTCWECESWSEVSHPAYH